MKRNFIVFFCLIIMNSSCKWLDDLLDTENEVVDSKTGFVVRRETNSGRCRVQSVGTAPIGVQILGKNFQTQAAATAAMCEVFEENNESDPNKCGSTFPENACNK